MLLTIDVGNTHTVVGFYDPDAPLTSADSGLAHHWRIATRADRTRDELLLVLRELVVLADLGVDDITGVAISSGVSPITQALRAMAHRYLDIDPVVIGPGVRTGIPVLYDNPKEVGADRIANAVGAVDLYGGPTICVDFGTATTFDAISRDNEYLGGAIFPGIEIGLQALADRAAALRTVELAEPRAVIGRSTVESVQSGTVWGAVAMVGGMCELFEEELGPSTVIATGGLGGLIARLSRRIEHYEPWLTLHGLRLVHAKNVGA